MVKWRREREREGQMTRLSPSDGFSLVQTVWYVLLVSGDGYKEVVREKEDTGGD